MKTFLLAFVFAAFVAHIQAEALDDYLLQDDEDGEPDRHPYVQCKIDLYDCVKAGTGKLECMKNYKNCMAVLIPTIPPFVIQCKDQLKSCISSASGLLGKSKCFIEFAKCLKNGGPPAGVLFDDEEPTRHPYFQCKIDLYKCFKAGAKGKLECMKDYKSCMAVLIPTIPPFVIACKNDLKVCVSSSSGLLNKAKCFKTFAICLKNKGSSVVFDEDKRGVADVKQCHVTLYSCYKNGNDKMQCLRDYRSCLAALLPTIPPFVTLCNDARKACLSGVQSGGWQGIKEKAKCYAMFAKCIANKGPSSSLVFDDQDGQPTRHPYVQCKIDAYDCVKSGKPKKECFSEYKKCMSVLLPTIPPFIGNCYADFRTCYGGASGWQDKLKCGLDFTKCLKNKGVTL